MPDSSSKENEPLDQKASGVPDPNPPSVEKPRELLKTDIGKVVGGLESLRRFHDLLAKTLRL